MTINCLMWKDLVSGVSEALLKQVINVWSKNLALIKSISFLFILKEVEQVTHWRLNEASNVFTSWSLMGFLNMSHFVLRELSFFTKCPRKPIVTSKHLKIIPFFVGMKASLCQDFQCCMCRSCVQLAKTDLSQASKTLTSCPALKSWNFISDSLRWKHKYSFLILFGRKNT